MTKEQLAETSPETEYVEEVNADVNDDAELYGDDDSIDEVEQTEEPVDDSEELEFNGEKYRMPKAVAEAHKSMQKDYTQKTQTLAEQRKTFERDAQFQQQNIQDIAKITALDEQIAQYKNLDWARLNQEDPSMFQQLRFQYEEIKDARGQLAGQLANKHQQVALMEQQETAKRIQESEAVLRREIKDWSPELESKLQNYAVSTFGFDPVDVQQSKSDPRLYKLLHAAFQGDQILKKQASKPVTPIDKAKPVTNLSGKAAKVSKQPYEMDDDEFASWRRAQIKRR